MATQVSLLSGAVASAGSLLLQTNGTTTQATIDTSGNLGLGVTPAAKFNIGSGGAARFNRSDNATYGEVSYGGAGVGMKYYDANSDGHRFFNGATQALTLDTSGNLGVGTTSPNTRLNVAGTQLDSNNTGNIFSIDTASLAANKGGGVLFGGYYTGTTSTAWAAVSGLKNNSTDGDYGGYLAFKTRANGGSLTEAARIDSSGNLLLGATSQTGGAKISVGGNSSTSRVVPNTDNVGYVGDSGARWQAIYAVNGTIQTSDGREKNAIQDSNLGLSFIQSLRPVSYKWNVGENIVTYDEEGNTVVTPRAGVRTHYGFIAQEVKAAVPENVDFGGFVQEPDDGPMSLRYHEFIGPLVKAIQELNAKVDAQAAEIAALKGQA
jgi:hypothetical protein